MKAPASIRLPLLLALGLVAAPAYAANEGRAAAPAPASQAGVAQLNEEGAALYSARDYRRAIEKFIQAYAIDSDPNLLFNIARCYEELGEVDAAIEKYENFLKTPGADTRGRQRARESLQTLRESRDKDSSHDPAARKAPAAAEHATDSAAPQARAEHETSLVPWLTLGGGVLFAAVGTTFYLLGASDHNQVTDARGYDNPDAVADMTRKEADDLVSSGNTKKVLGGVSLGLAGALAATYVVLMVTGDDSPSEESNVALTVLPSRSGAALSVQGSF
jgi:tetratricopeptide (TPR) repeat protein